MEVERIYFDMDDVLVDFTGAVRDQCGLEIKGENAVSDDILFESIRILGDFYQRAKPIPGSLELFTSLRKRYGDRVEILTAVPKPSRNLPKLGDDKVAWVGRYLGDSVRVNIVLRREKPSYVGGKGSVLIDDSIGNIRAWEDAGGTGILFTDPASARSILDSLGIRFDGTT